jgi:hypothetical protein
MALFCERTRYFKCREVVTSLKCVLKRVSGRGLCYAEKETEYCCGEKFCIVHVLDLLRQDVPMAGHAGVGHRSFF